MRLIDNGQINGCAVNCTNRPESRDRCQCFGLNIVCDWIKMTTQVDEDDNMDFDKTPVIREVVQSRANVR